MPQLILAIVTAAILAALPNDSYAQAHNCGKGQGISPALKPGSATNPTNLVVDGNCRVTGGTYNYANINVVAGGVLKFDDAKIDLWTSGIVVENGGTVIAGEASAPIKGPLTIHLWGDDQGTTPGGAGTPCVQPLCGIPQTTVWDTNGNAKVNVNGPAPDYFYQYSPLMYDGQGSPVGYFGYKSIGVSYGGTLRLHGKKGATYGAVASSDSGTSWRRLDGTLPSAVAGRQNTFVVDRVVDWEVGDRVVITTTDYLPSHSEEVEIVGPASADKRTFTAKHVRAGDPPLPVFQYRHQGEKYPLPNDLDRLKLAGNPKSVETRAAVALLTRSIVIVSEGTKIGEPLAANSYFGGHTIARAGFKQFQVQGVEFRLMGQGGRLGHYPVHFHEARRVPADTYVKDSSVNESMTRWYALHATSGVLLARNVGWKSIGHGYYIEEGTETDNKLHSNIGIYARPAIQNAVVNPRNVPGILAAPYDPTRPENVPFYSDVDHPTIFWIMNGWNDFEYNMAAGAGACGACFWLVPGAASGHSRHRKFEGYASMQQTMNPNPLDKAATTPLRTFVGNYCSTAMTSFNTVGNQTPCYGIMADAPMVPAVPNPLAPAWCNQTNPVPPSDPACQGPNPPASCANGCQLPANAPADMYYPKVDQGGGRFATICPSDSQDCSATPRCDTATLDSCMVTVIDKYTSSFHWNEHNYGAIWLRPQWYLFANSVLTDVQNAGLTFVTGGGYTKSDLVQGHWALARKSLFIGNTQPPAPAGQKDYASNAGPFNPNGIPASGSVCSGNHCLSANDGVSLPATNFAMNQRMFSIYDGPAYQESNAYLDITRTKVTDCAKPGQDCQNTSAFLSGRIVGLPWHKTLQMCYLPNAAIAWKQSNGFYYPPAFHSANLYFKNVDIRHYVIQPLFLGDTYVTDFAQSRLDYCNTQTTMFNNWSDIDRQTELSDDDGSLTGYAKTVSVNVDKFFSAPVEAIECESDGTAKTSPYDYVTTVVYPEVGFTNQLPPGLQFTAAPTGTCPGVQTDSTLTRLFIPVGVGIPPSGCTITGQVTGATPGTYTNTTSMLQTNLGSAPSASAQLTVTGSMAPATVPSKPIARAAPTLAAAFSPMSITAGGTSTLTITIGNPNAAPAILEATGWSKQCSDNQCFGVPMYRQSLVKGENTTGPIRLAGQNTYNRSTLTPNNGIFYIDTTNSQAKQTSAWPGVVNVSVYQPNTHYYLFMLFANAKTAQTYQFYVGTPFDPNKDVWAVRADIKSDPVKFSAPNGMAWPAGWGRSYENGVLTVTMNMGFPGFGTEFNKAFKDNCQPSSFCTWKEGIGGGTCGCNASGRFADLCGDTNKAGEDVCAWAQKDVDCPNGGCYGIGFKTGATFVYDPPVNANPRPARACFPKNALWNVSYVPASPAGIAQSCTNAPKLPLQFCGD